MNIALLFSYTKQIKADLEAERTAHAETRRKAEEERQKLIDAVARAARQPAIFTQPPPPVPTPTMAFGPTMIAAQRAQHADAVRASIDTPPTDDEIAAAAEAARQRANGNGK
jgi:plasmid stabilization system protein ParE